MDSKLREGDSLVDDSAKKKFKFKSFKKFFGLKKRKESLPSLGNSSLKQSQSAGDVAAPESRNTDYDSEDDIETASGVLGSRAVSHDSIFIPEIVQEAARPVRIFSQENVSDHIKALQLKLQSNIKIGPPPIGMITKRTEDPGTSSEDDGLPRSPPEMSLIHETIKTRFSDIHRHHSSLSLGGTGSEEDEQISSETSSRPLSPDENMMKDKPKSFSEKRDSGILSPSTDFSSPPQFSTFLDNSAAKHRLSVKPRNQKKSKIRRPSAALQEESFAGIIVTEEEDVTAPEPENPDNAAAEPLPTNRDDSSNANTTLQNLEENRVASTSMVEGESQIPSEEVLDPIPEPNRLQSVNVQCVPPVTLDEEIKVSDKQFGGSELKSNNMSFSSLSAELKNTSPISLPSSKKQSMKVFQVPIENEEKPSNAQEIADPVRTTPLSYSEESLQSRRNLFRHSLSERSPNTSEQLISDKENNKKFGNMDKKAERSPTEAGTQRKFSVSSAWERPRTNSFNLRANNEGDGGKTTKLSLPKASVSKNEHIKEEAPVTAQTENKLTGRKKETMVDSESIPSDKPVIGNITAIQSAVPAASDLSMATDIQAAMEDQNPFFKLRPTSLSLRYREGMGPVTTTVKRHSAEIKQEKAGPVPSKDEIPEAEHPDLTTSCKSQIKEDPIEVAQTKPPLPKKPVLQNITVADNNTNKEMAENESGQEKKSKSPEVKSENKISERRASLQKNIDKTPSAVDSGKGGENKVQQPSWMSMARPKQLSFKDEHSIYKQRTASQETDKQNKDKTEVNLKQQTDQPQNKTTNTAVVPEESKTEIKEPRQRANTLPYPMPGTQLSLLTEKEEKVTCKRPTLSVSKEPSWMELAKKKSQAWSDMPQIIK